MTVDGTVAGLHRSPFHGYSAEFSQYRHYRAGDDLKYVDWKLFARTDRIYTKQFRETTNLLSQMALDASASMGLRRRQRRDQVRVRPAARRRAVAPGGRAGRRRRAGGLRRRGPAVHSEPHRTFAPAEPAASRCRRVEPGGRTAAAAALRRATELLKRRGLIVLFSDLYDDEEAVERELRRAVRMGHEVAVFHVLTPEEMTLGLDGEVEVEDLESGQTVLTRASVARGRLSSALRRVPGALAHSLHQPRNRLHPGADRRTAGRSAAWVPASGVGSRGLHGDARVDQRRRRWPGSWRSLGPVVVHLLRRQRARRVLFPTLQFLVSTRAAAARLRTPSDLPLLALRVAIVAAAAIAAAQPFLVTGWRRAAWEQRVARALVIDTSESMARRGLARRRRGRGRAAGLAGAWRFAPPICVPA